MAITGTTSRTTTPDGRDVFVKELDGAPPLFFEREAVGLRALAAAGARVPEVLAVDHRSLALSWIEQGGAGRTDRTDTGERFGRELAALHGTTGARWGPVDGEPTAYLGACPIDLTPCETWHESWVQRRLVPLAREAADAGRLDPAAVTLAEQIRPEHLGPQEPPTLVHGDLWAGNRLVDGEGQSWLIDPCAHYGHREVDLAMMRLFGGFGEGAFAAYAEVSPLADGWAQRVAVYQAVPLLVHAILFGGGYAAQSAEALRLASR
ncbi:fructosamine kinase family protein [Ornithinimicrobium faecis]|uniref:fructosamine kinase family protein n=1 Tax=Ornithinimicrobium faecis TaxID=2934158 RepID=UPI0021191591|nr:fructosamine kinase family protein [Ornithinimicrobium sp. HY1745]